MNGLEERRRPWTLLADCPRCEREDVHHVGEFTTVDSRAIDMTGPVIRVLSGCRVQKVVDRSCRSCGFEWRMLWPWPCIDPPVGPGEVRACVPPCLAVMVDDVRIPLLPGHYVLGRIDEVIRDDDGHKILVGTPSSCPIQPRRVASSEHLAYIHMPPNLIIVTDACIDRRKAGS